MLNLVIYLRFNIESHQIRLIKTKLECYKMYLYDKNLRQTVNTAKEETDFISIV